MATLFKVGANWYLNLSEKGRRGELFDQGEDDW